MGKVCHVSNISSIFCLFEDCFGFQGYPGHSLASRPVKRYVSLGLTGFSVLLNSCFSCQVNRGVSLRKRLEAFLMSILAHGLKLVMFSSVSSYIQDHFCLQLNGMMPIKKLILLALI